MRALSITLPALAAVVSLLMPVSARSADQTRDLLRYVPESANVVGVIRVEEILGSRRARIEQWADKQKDKFLAGAAVIPPWASTCVYASRVQPEVANEQWNVLLLSLPRSFDIQQVARHEGAKVETLAGVDVVRARRDAYFASLAPGILGSRSPALRTDVARWIRATADSTEPRLSPYLRDAALAPAHIVLAVDLLDSVDPERARQRLKEMRELSLEDSEIDPLVALAQSLRGLRVQVDVGNTTQAEMSIDFGSPVGDRGAVVKAIALDALRHHGLDLPELASSTVRANDASVTISAQLSDASLRKILSLIAAPNPHHPAEETQTAGTGEPPSPAVDRPDASASKSYFEAVDRALEDVERPSWSADNAGTEAWLERYAKKIDSLPIAGVDPELVKYAASQSARLRALAASLRGVDVAVEQQENTITYNTQYDPGWSYLGWWGAVGYRAPSYNVTSNLQEVRERQAQTVTQGTEKREQIWQMIDDDRNKIRAAMQQKYGADFAD